MDSQSSVVKSVVARSRSWSAGLLPPLAPLYWYQLPTSPPAEWLLPTSTVSPTLTVF